MKGFPAAWRGTGRVVARVGSAAGLVALGLWSQYFFNALALIVLARRVLPLEYGQYSATIALTGLSVVLPALGLDAWILARSGDAQAQLLQTWQRGLRLRLLLLGIWVLGLVVLSPLLPHDAYPVALLATLALAIGGESVTQLGVATLRSREQHGRVALVQATAAGGVLLLALLLPLAPGRLIWFALARAGVALAAALYVTLLLRRAVRRLLPAARYAGLSWRAMATAARPFFFSEAATLVYMRADLVLVGLLLGSAAAAIYSPALTLLRLGLLLPNALFYASVPVLGRGFRRHPATFREEARRRLGLSIGAGGLVALAVWLGAPLLVWIFGPGYGDAVPVLQLLAPIGLLRGFNFGLAAVLIAAARQPQRTRVQVVCAAINVAANLWAIPRYGLSGVAVIYVLSELLLCLGYARAAWPQFKQRQPAGDAGE